MVSSPIYVCFEQNRGVPRAAGANALAHSALPLALQCGWIMLAPKMGCQMKSYCSFVTYTLLVSPRAFLPFAKEGLCNPSAVRLDHK